jgi:hypothetical protein
MNLATDIYSTSTLLSDHLGGAQTFRGHLQRHAGETTDDVAIVTYHHDSDSDISSLPTYAIRQQLPIILECSTMQ